MDEVTPDDTKLGPFCFCVEHLRVHETGWCTVNNTRKFGIQASTLEEAQMQFEKMCHLIHLGGLLQK